MRPDVEALKRLMPSSPAVTVQYMVVAAVRDDGLLNLQYGETNFPGIPAEASYNPRTVGDVVPVWRTTAGLRAGSPTGPPTVVGDVDSTVTRWGEGAPAGSGWQKATSVWVRDGEVYAQLTAPPSAPPTSPTRSPKKKLPTTADGLWSGGHKASWINSGHPVQGGYGSNPNNVGGWFYGSTIAAACTGKTVKSMTVRLSRRGTGGRSGGVLPRLGLHNYTSPPYGTPTLTSRWSTGQKLGWGEGADFTIPPDQRAALASGAAKGIGCSAPNGNDGYILYTAGSGVLTITFD